MPEPTPKARAEAAQHLLDALDFDDDLALSDAQRVGIIAAALLTAEARGRQAGLAEAAQIAFQTSHAYRDDEVAVHTAEAIYAAINRLRQPTPPEGG